ncbi:MAG: SDR family NAD(P)-dependent oxidoreductase [Myxococcota bacterium]
MRRPQTVVITGAASGIGRETALAFARQNAVLELLDIDASGLEAVVRDASAAGARAANASQVDVADAERVRGFGSELEQRGVQPDVLINNAGVLVAGGFLETELEDWRWILQTNLLGVVHMTRALLPGMIARRRGHVLNVASAAAFWNPPPLTAYGASKYALVGLSEALREEMRPHGVRVTAVCPAFVVTPIVDHMRLRGSYAARDTRRLARAYAEQRGVRAEVVGEAIVRATERNVGVLPVGREAWALSWLKRLFPGILSRVAGASAELFSEQVR